LYLAEFRNRVEELKNALAASRSNVRDLEISLREVDASGREIKRAMKEATNSEYAISQKLAYEKGAHQGLEAEFKAVLKSLHDQITIAGYDVELHDLKGAANYAIDCIAVPSEGDEERSIVDRLIDTPNRLLTLLRGTSLAAATDALVRVKSHYRDVDLAKIKGGVDTTKDLKVLELEVEEAAMEVMDNIDYEGDGGDQ
jgi:seryl-tRNA synthetase